MTNFNDVREFHRAFSVDDPNIPGFPDTDTIRLRIKLIQEEFDEVVAGIENRDLHNVAKELCDLLYVTYGTGLAFGIDLDTCFKEVQRSNMSKLGADGRPLRREDGKVLKGPDYSPADMTKIF